MQCLVRGVVVSAERLADEVEAVNPVLGNTSYLQDLRAAINRLKVLYADEFGEVI